jgi:NAD(P)-dependent dehydrogenase (short-subunit alcohol dehydrogenase family)
VSSATTDNRPDLPKVVYPDLAGASVFITGGGSGIGAALTEGFLRQGAKVAFVQRSDATAFCDTMAAATGRRPLFIPCDITDVAALQAAVAQAAKAHGPVGVLVNNAANDKRHTTEEVDEGFWDRMLAVNLKAYFFATQAVVPMMRAAGGGSIINFTSISYMMGQGIYPIYTAANAAINAMTRGHAREFGADRIRVNALAPGWVLTQKQKDLWVTPEGLAAHLDKQCLKDPIAPDDIVGGVLFLASRTSRMMTGQALVIDGGVVVTG